MRLWSLHPRYLDAKGLVALWREALLAQKVLQGLTKGYTRHPQLTRFRETDAPVGAIGAYLEGVVDEADRRGYHFRRDKIVGGGYSGRIAVTSGQIAYERQHLLAKLEARSPDRFETFSRVRDVQVHPIFCLRPGEIAEWEVVRR